MSPEEREKLRQTVFYFPGEYEALCDDAVERVVESLEAANDALIAFKICTNETAEAVKAFGEQWAITSSYTEEEILGELEQ